MNKIYIVTNGGAIHNVKAFASLDSMMEYYKPKYKDIYAYSVDVWYIAGFDVKENFDVYFSFNDKNGARYDLRVQKVDII